LSLSHSPNTHICKVYTCMHVYIYIAMQRYIKYDTVSASSESIAMMHTFLHT